MRMLLTLSVFRLGNLAYAQNAKDFYADQEVQNLSNSLSHLPAGTRNRGA